MKTNITEHHIEQTKERKIKPVHKDNLKCILEKKQRVKYVFSP